MPRRKSIAFVLILPKIGFPPVPVNPLHGMVEDEAGLRCWPQMTKSELQE